MNLRVFLTALVLTTSTFSYIYFEPVIAPFLIDDYGTSQVSAGLIITVVSATYAIFTVLFGFLPAKKEVSKY